MNKTLILTVIWAVLFNSVSAEVPVVNKCSKADSKCAKNNAIRLIPIFAAGIPEYGIEPMDPLHFNELDASTNGVKLVLTDVTVKGIKDCKAKKIQWYVPTSMVRVKLLCDTDLVSQYEMSGRLLIIPIEGKGKAHIKCRKIVLTNDILVEDKVGDDGKVYWDIKHWNHTYELKDKADVNFDNLFNGNELLGHTAHEIIAANGNDIIMEVGQPVIKAIVDQITETIRKYFTHVPAEDISLD